MDRSSFSQNMCCCMSRGRAILWLPITDVHSTNMQTIDVWLQPLIVTVTVMQ